MNAKEKNIAKLKLAVYLWNCINENKVTGSEGSVSSLRKLAASSGVEYSIIQKIASAKKDPQFTTLIALVDGLEMKLGDFFNGIDSVTDQDIVEFKAMIQTKQKAKGAKKIKKKK